MNPRFPIAVAVFAVSSAGLFFGCTDPADPIDFGDLCVPDTADCPSSAQLQRPGAGRNLLEYSVYAEDQHPGGSPTFRVTTDEDLELPDERPRTDGGDLILFEEQIPLEPGGRVDGDLGGFELTVASRMELELVCDTGDCHARLEYLYLSEAIECIDDDVCGRNAFCERVYGRCATCRDDTDCDRFEECNRPLGECAPPETSAASSVPEDDFGPPWPALALLAASACLVCGGRRRRLAAVAIAACVIAVPAGADADSGASMQAGGSFHLLNDKVGELTGPGWGLNVNHQLRWRRIGAAFELSTHSFGVDDTVGSGQHRLSGYAIAAGPRVFQPLPITIPGLVDDRPLEAFLAVDYALWTVADNRLARITGLELQYHAVGPTLAVNWRWAGLKASLRTGYRHIFDWPGGVFSIGLMVGIGP